MNQRQRRSRPLGQRSLGLLLLQGGLGSLCLGYLCATPAAAQVFSSAQVANQPVSPSPPAPIPNNENEVEENAPSVIWLIVMPAIPIVAGGAICLSRRLRHSCAEVLDGTCDDGASAAAITPSMGPPPDPDHPTAPADAPDSPS